jgi:hypothetical protein
MSNNSCHLLLVIKNEPIGLFSYFKVNTLEKMVEMVMKEGVERKSYLKLPLMMVGTFHDRSSSVDDS